MSFGCAWSGRINFVPWKHRQPFVCINSPWELECGTPFSCCFGYVLLLLCHHQWLGWIYLFGGAILWFCDIFRENFLFLRGKWKWELPFLEERDSVFLSIRVARSYLAGTVVRFCVNQYLISVNMSSEMGDIRHIVLWHSLVFQIFCLSLICQETETEWIEWW